jgi:hypothetical protein
MTVVDDQAQGEDARVADPFRAFRLLSGFPSSSHRHRHRAQVA